VLRVHLQLAVNCCLSGSLSSLEARDLFYLLYSLESPLSRRSAYAPLRRAAAPLFIRKRGSLESPSAEAMCECASPSRRSLTYAPALYTEPLKEKAIRRWNCEGRGWVAQSLTVSVLWMYLGYIRVVYINISRSNEADNAAGASPARVFWIRSDNVLMFFVMCSS
jgi:hypothetical protein